MLSFSVHRDQSIIFYDEHRHVNILKQPLQIKKHLKYKKVNVHLFCFNTSKFLVSCHMGYYTTIKNPENNIIYSKDLIFNFEERE